MDLNETLKELVTNFNYKSGVWTIPSCAREASCGIVELPDGRKAEVQLRVETEQEDWIDKTQVA